MPLMSVDLIEWDGRRFCALMWPYLFVLQPGYRDNYSVPVVDLDFVFAADDGQEIKLDLIPADRQEFVINQTLSVWQKWEEKFGDSLLRHPAVRIHVDAEYETVVQRGSPEEILKRVFTRQREKELTKIAQAAEQRRRRRK